MTEPALIDTHMHGRPGITGAFLLGGDRTALLETGPRTSLQHVLDGLEANGVTDLDWIVVTHIHLDHAGAAGTLAARFPNAKVAVHEVGAPHLVDPSKLWSSASRIYGDAMERLWGGIDPIDPDRIHVLRDGDKIDLGGRTIQAIETPGHAGHHHAYLDDLSGVVFTGDALGVRLPETGVMRPATPPPEFNLESAIGSIRKIRSAGAASLWLTHYGASDRGIDPTSVEETCDRAIDALERWASWIRETRSVTKDIDEVTAAVKQKVEDDLKDRLSSEAVDRMEQTTSYRMNTWGYMRYFDKQEA